MSTDHDRQLAGHSDHHDRANGAESPRELLAVHDPSRRTAANSPQMPGRGEHEVTVQWVRPTELAARVAARTTAGAVAAHAAAHRQARESLRARLAGGVERQSRLAPVSAFGRQVETGPVTVERSVIGR